MANESEKMKERGDERTSSTGPSEWGLTAHRGERADSGESGEGVRRNAEKPSWPVEGAWG